MTPEQAVEDYISHCEKSGVRGFSRVGSGFVFAGRYYRPEPDLSGMLASGWALRPAPPPLTRGNGGLGEGAAADQAPCGTRTRDMRPEASF